MSNLSNRKIKTAKDLLQNGFIWDSDFAHIEEIEKNFSISINRHLVHLMNKNPASNAIRKQYIPSKEELQTTKLELNDPIGDKAHNPVKGIVHRYPDRVLFKVVNVCPVYCRYCFRREMLQNSEDAMKMEEYKEAIDYIKANKQIWEVILTGGDPMILSQRKMSYILSELSTIEHVQVVRIHTRTPIASPDLIDDDYIQCIIDNCTKPIYMVLHVNHADEIDETCKNRIKALHKAGVNLLSQSVLLKGVNDNAEILEQLFRTLITLNVKPYYLHHPDMARGTSHFRLSLKDGIAIYKSLLGNVSGLCQPSYMLDIPGGFGKVPINTSYLEDTGNNTYIVEDYQGNKHHYCDDFAATRKHQA